MLMTAGQFFAIIFTLAMPPLIDMEHNWYTAPSQFTPVAILMLATTFVSAAFMFLFNGAYKRLEAENNAIALRSQRSSFVGRFVCPEPEP